MLCVCSKSVRVGVSYQTRLQSSATGFLMSDQRHFLYVYFYSLIRLYTGLPTKNKKYNKWNFAGNKNKRKGNGAGLAWESQSHCFADEFLITHVHSFCTDTQHSKIDFKVKKIWVNDLCNEINWINYLIFNTVYGRRHSKPFMFRGTPCTRGLLKFFNKVFSPIAYIYMYLHHSN